MRPQFQKPGFHLHPGGFQNCCLIYFNKSNLCIVGLSTTTTLMTYFGLLELFYLHFKTKSLFEVVLCNAYRNLE